MTDRADLRDTAPVSGMPRWWWARGLNLRERLASGVCDRSAPLEPGEAPAPAPGGEPPRWLGSRTATPEWARYIEQAVAAAPQGPAKLAEPASPDLEGCGVFLPMLRPLILPAWDAVAAGLVLPPAEHAPVRAAFEERLGEQLARQAARTLVTELSRARAAGRLAGATPRDRFASFTAGLGTRQGLAGLFARYPVLARILGQTALDAAAAMAETTRRLHADRERIAAALFQGVSPGALVRVEPGRGDAHQGNKSVAVLHFEAGSVVYKPRPLDQHALLDEAVGWLNAKVPGLGLRTPRSLRREGYGWLEFIEHRWCESATEADRFYRRLGALLCLLYAVDGTDMHCENLIACGDQPVIVDAETLLHSGLPVAATSGADPAARALEDSVHRTGLLPHLVIGENGALDLSAIGGRSERDVDPSDVVRWEGAGTDEMRVVRGPAAGPASRNQPLPRGGAAGHADHRAALLEGFRTSYDAIARHRAELLDGDGVLARWAQAPARLIVRATRLYSTLLDESTHPGLLRDALARDAVLAVLWTESRQDPARQRLIEEEIADLWRGDVPLFFHRPGGTAVWSARGVRLDGALPASSLGAVQAKIAAMSEVDRYDQEWVISATLAVGSANTALGGPRSRLAPRPGTASVPTPSRLLAAACGVADEIAARAVRGDGRANWLCMEQVAGRHWAVLPMGGGLAEGYCGVALFLAQIGRLSGAQRYTALARQAMRPLPLLLACVAEDPELSAAVGPGALSGLGGIVYALVRLSALLGDDVGACLPAAVAALGQAVDGPSGNAFGDMVPVDLADGLAGALVAAVSAHQAGADAADAAGRLARRLAGRLLEVGGKGVGSPGFAHGDSGIGWALLRYAAVPAFSADARPHAAAGSALLRSALDTALCEGDLSWYSGLSGVVLAAADASAHLGHRGVGDGFDHFTRLLARAPAEDLSLRQGTLGLLEPLLVLAERGHTGAREGLTRCAGGVLGLIEQQGHRCATPDHVPSPGLLAGLSGIGYNLLRVGFPEQVPSVAVLEHTSRPSAPRTAARITDPSRRIAL